MKSRTMKKWIPKNTCYCYSRKNGKIKPCKWWTINPNKESQLNGYCKYIKKGDWYENVTMLLFDQCKECNLKMYSN